MSNLERIGNVDFGPILEFARSQPRRAPWEHVRMGEDGLPEDRSICPWCRGDRLDCRTCGGSGVVCPTCRGARLLRTTNPVRPVSVACEDCTDWSDHPNHSWDDHGWPQFRYDSRREAAIVRAYRATQRRVMVSERAIMTSTGTDR